MLDQQEHHIEKMHKHLWEKRRKEKQQEFSQKQLVINIKRQLTGAAMNDEIMQEVLQKAFNIPPEHINLIENFFTWPISGSPEDK